VESSELFGSSLYVPFAPNAPAAPCAMVLHRPLVGTCDVPGGDAHEFAGRWNRRFRRYGTALVTDPPVLVARVATACALYVGREGVTPGTLAFPRPPFSRVRMR
jgi:hypothetical protein